jgi:hypothetical protein
MARAAAALLRQLTFQVQEERGEHELLGHFLRAPPRRASFYTGLLSTTGDAAHTQRGRMRRAAGVARAQGARTTHGRWDPRMCVRRRILTQRHRARCPQYGIAGCSMAPPKRCYDQTLALAALGIGLETARALVDACNKLAK